MKLLLALVLVGAVSAVPEEDHFVNSVMPGLAVRGGTTFLFSSTATVTRTIETQITTLATCVAAASNLPTCSARAEARFFAFVPTANEQRYELQPEARAVDHLEPSFESGLVIDHGRIIEFLPPIGLLTVVTNTAWEIMVTATVSHPTDTVTISLAGCVPQILPFSVAACVATGTSTTNTATTTTSGTTTTGTSTTPTTTTSATTTTTPVVSSTSTTSTTPTATTTTTPASATTSVTTSSTPPMSPTVVATVTSTVTTTVTATTSTTPATSTTTPPSVVTVTATQTVTATVISIPPTGVTTTPPTTAVTSSSASSSAVPTGATTVTPTSSLTPTVTSLATSVFR